MSTPAAASPALDLLTAPFPSPFYPHGDEYGTGSQPRSLVELRLQELLAAVRVKPDWHRKLRDASTRGKWLQEATAAAASTAPPLSAADLQYAFAELDWLAAQHDAAVDGIERSVVDGVWQSDRLLQPALLSALQQQVVALLEQPVREEDRDWHPGSSQQVWDLVHPSLYCLVAGRSRLVQQPQPLTRALQLQGQGAPMSRAEFKHRAMLIRSVPVSNQGNRDAARNKAAAAQAAAAIAQAASAELDPEAEAKAEAELAAAAQAAGKIAIVIPLQFSIRSLKQQRTVYVSPTAAIADVRAAVLQRSWNADWTAGEFSVATYEGNGGQQLHAIRDESRTLLHFHLHQQAAQPARHLQLRVYDRQQEEQAATRALPQPRVVSLRLTTSRGVELLDITADEADTVDDLKRRLRDGHGEGEHAHVVAGAPVEEQQLLLRGEKLLYGPRQLRFYGLYNQPPVATPQLRICIVWRRLGVHSSLSEKDAFLQRQLEGSVEICIRLLNPPLQLPHLDDDKEEDDESAKTDYRLAYQRQELHSAQQLDLLMDVRLDATVAALKLRIGRSHPMYGEHRRLPAANQHLLFPCPEPAAAAGQAELEDGRTLAQLGVQAGDVLGLRWEPMQQEEQQKQRLQQQLEQRLKQQADARQQRRAAEAAQKQKHAAGSPAVPEAGLPPAADEDEWNEGWLPLSEFADAPPAAEAIDLMVSLPPREELQLPGLPLSSTIAQVKQRLAELKGKAKGVAVSQQRLSMRLQSLQSGVPVARQLSLRDDRSLAWYGLQAHTRLHWSLFDTDEKQVQRPQADDVEIRVTLTTSESDRDLHSRSEVVVLSLSDTIAELCSVVRAEDAAVYATPPPRTRVLPLSRPLPPALNGGLTLQQCGLRDGSEVWLDAQVAVDVYLQPAHSRSRLLAVPRYSSVAELKRRIAQLPGAPAVEHQCVRLLDDTHGVSRQHGTRTRLAVVDDLSLSQLGVRLGTGKPLQLLVFPTAQRRHPQDDRQDLRTLRERAAAGTSAPADDELILLRVRIDSNDVFELPALRSEPLRSIKWRLVPLLDVAPEEQQLFLSGAGEPLPDDSATLAACGVSDGHQLQLRLHLLQVALMLQGGRQLTVPISCTDTVAQLKAVVEARSREEVRAAAAVAAAPGGAGGAVMGNLPAPANFAAFPAPFGMILPALQGLAGRGGAPQQPWAVFPRALQHLRFPSMLQRPVDDAATLEAMGFTRPVPGTRPRGPFTQQSGQMGPRPVVHVVLRQTPRPQRGSADLMADRAGDDEAVLVQLQLGPGATLHPFLLFRHEVVAELKRFICCLFPLQAGVPSRQPGTLTAVTDVAVSVAGRAWTAAGSVLDQRVVQAACLLVEPVWPSPGGLGLPGPGHANDEKGGEADMEDEDDDDGEDGSGTGQQGKRQRLDAAADARPLCRYGQQCYRKNPQHLAQFRHPHLERQQGARRGAQQGRYEEEDEKDDRTGVDFQTSTCYAWLPADFAVDAAGEVRCLSYINNLHPVRHAALYATVSSVLRAFLPLFERVLTELRQPRPTRVPVGSWYDDGDGDSWKRRQRDMQDADGKEQSEAEDEEGDGDDDDYDGDPRPVLQPEALLPFAPPPPPPSVVSLRGRTLQVIVKLCNIVLTPAAPHYAGGVWHVEGMRNEAIVSSGIAYYAQDNIGPSQLAFRTAVAEPEYEQNDSRGVERVYGLVDDSALVQPAGAVQTSNGRCIAFPNVLQHQVQPFSLVDPSRAGHRKILVLFLVDPTQRITSTAVVPPQQADWTVQERREAMTAALPATDLQDLVQQYVGWPMTLLEARRHRDGLMKERKFFVQENTTQLFERPFSLCEH